jgi:predicted MPP superfamily phosphohydrolase
MQFEFRTLSFKQFLFLQLSYLAVIIESQHYYYQLITLMNRVLFLTIAISFIILLDLYLFQAVRVLTSDLSAFSRRLVHIGYWSITVLAVVAILLYNLMEISQLKSFRSFLLVFVFVNIISKLTGGLFLLVDDLIRLVSFVISKFSSASSEASFSPSRSNFLSKSALVATAAPAAIMGFGVLSGAYDYRVRRKTIVFPNLPAAFDGIRIAQLSDIHSGSFFDKPAVKGGVELLLGEKPDMIFFTGDMINNRTDEVKDYVEVFNKVKAPLGVYATLGNHDYGDYTSWPSEEAKRQNVADLVRVEREMGWDVLLDENRYITVGNEKISVLGVQNWGAGRFQKYGNLDKTVKGSDDAPFKIMLSHDPSHWDAQIRPKYKDIDLTLSGHTHGMQFGIEIGDFRWSPAQYVYKQWADLYKEENQYLYVNRGFGFIGYPGRVGILPEITIIELKRA